MSYRADSCASLAALDPADWDALAGPQPFTRHAFLSALEESGCVGGRSGWAPRHLLLYEAGRLAGAMPLYLKDHSYGEYVFDWAWADAHHRHGIAYYPKLLCCVPFTPVPGTRLLAGSDAARNALARTAVELARDSGLSSLHVLFPREAEAAALAGAGCMIRGGVQFHWVNRGYASFEDHLAAMNHDKRKKIRQERRKVAAAGIVFRRLAGSEVGEAELDFFHRCYRDTYRRHRSSPYLNREFFRLLGQRLPGCLALMLAERDGVPVGCALDIRDGEALYGRYWGALEDVPGLHFEACYHQGIEFCVEQGLHRLEGGAQGEHKLARGLEPVRTVSAHWLAHPAFAEAVEDFLGREHQGLGRYLDELTERSPFRR